jgi:hypothetical protein
VLRRQHGGDRLEVPGERHDQISLALMRELDALIAERVRVDAVLVVEHREGLLALLERAA